MGLGKLLDSHGSLREFEVNNRFNLTLNLCTCIKCSLFCIVAWIDLSSIEPIIFLIINQLKTKSDYGAQSNKDIEIKILTKTSQMKRKSLENFSNQFEEPHKHVRF